MPDTGIGATGSLPMRVSVATIRLYTRALATRAIRGADLGASELRGFARLEPAGPLDAKTKQKAPH